VASVLPGDYSPPSRFVRAAFFGANHPTPPTTIDGVQELFHLLNAFDIPMGVAKVGDTSDFTQVTVVRDARELTYSHGAPTGISESDRSI
jgi:choloylglycine hydrolase